MPELIVRAAEKADAAALAELIDLAGEGLPRWLWGEMADGGEDALAVGRRRAEREEGGFSYRNAVVAEQDGRVVGLLLGMRQPDPYDIGDLAALAEPLRPVVELEALAPGSWYVNALAVRPEARGQGVARRLIAEAERLARDAGARTLSLIVADENEPARRLYEAVGFQPFSSLPIVPWPGAPHGGDWLLMVRPVGG